MRRIIYLISLFYLLSNKCIFAQINYKTPNMPTSPEVAKITQYGNIPVNNFSGNASPSIPIYTIKEGDIEIPINLTYTSSGIKVEEQATWVGLGWELSPEGIITQEVRGRNDELGMMDTQSDYKILYDRLDVLPPLDFQKATSQIGLSTVMLKQPQLLTCADDSPPTQIKPEDPAMPIIMLDQGYGQPDIFNFSFLGHVGEFYINPDTGNIVMLNKKENIKWERNTGGTYKYIATTEDGIKYFFGDMETIYYNGVQSQSQYDNYSFKLTKIRLVNGKEIFFDYIDGKYYNVFYTQNNIIPNNLSTEFGDPLKYQYNRPIPQFSNSDTKILQRIRTEQVTIEFNLENRQDIYPTNFPLKRVASIDIISNVSSKKIKSVQFTHDYFPYSEKGFPSNVVLLSTATSNKDAFGKRLKLNKISELFYKVDGTVDSDKTRDYSFDYNLSQTLPSKLSFSKDFWGYYNGSDGYSLTPKMEYFIARGYIGNQQMNQSYTESSNNKFSNSLYQNAYMLNKITYPTKGYTIFEYETNTFTNEYIPTMQEEGLMNKNIPLNNNGIGGYQTSVPLYNLNLPIAKKIKFSNEIHRGIPNAPMQTQAYTYYQMRDAGAAIKLFKVDYYQNGNESLTEIKKWDLTTVSSLSFETNLKAEWQEEINLTAGNYRVQLYIDNSMYSPTDLYHIAGVKSTIRYYADPTTNISTQMGVRIANIKNYDSNGSLISHKKYSYSNGVSNNKFNLLTGYNRYEFETNYERTLPYTISYFSISGADMYSYVTYSDVKISDIDIYTNLEKGSTTYNYYNFGNYAYTIFPVQKNPVNGLLYMETIKENNKTVLENYYKYKDISNKERFLSVQSVNNYINERPFPIKKNNGFCYPKHTYYVTPLTTTYYKQDSIIKKNYLGGKILKSKEYFEYNNLGSIKRNEEIFDNSIISTEYKYTEDVGNYYLDMKNIVGVPLLTEIKKNGKTISKTETVYPTDQIDANNSTSGLPLPKSVSALDLLSGGMSTEVTYNQYDSKGNILQYTTKNGVPTAIIWDKSQTQPIAKVEGATYTQASAVGGDIVTASDQSQVGYSETNLLAKLDAFRNDATLNGFQITTYTYKPLIGVSSITPPSGIREIYIYDTANRLQEVRDASGKLLKSYEYHYKP